MKTKDLKLNLIENLNALEKSIQWLNRSYNICKEIGIKEEYTEEEFDAFETLTGRYARVTDLIIQKVFRSIDAVELEDGGTILDVVNRAEKRELIDSVKRIREIKDLRNQIVHEYVIEDLKKIFAEVLKVTEELIVVNNNIRIYCKKHFNL
ncbi:HepT-like ribonuclease domain-containing protein [Candidatus Margulisiibacteriota bacterium]